MAGLVYDLMDILEDELLLYNKLLEISKRKTDIIVAGDVNALHELTKEEQEVVAKNLKLEKQREEIIGDIALVLNEKKETLTITRLIERLGDLEEDKKRLKEIQSKIKDVLAKLKQSNEQNKVLLEQSMEMISYTINAIQSTRSFSTNDYSNGGKIQNQSGQNFFDTRQ
ncbi:flagellar protein FlgN [Defluviitalea phaphyphila]|uniref:flagellar protein FlgN n=1 Tax=Defluviitalea phaphyphila TaxID=1473580 RepID=UPI00118769D2|nr:flagellar protein FlgN [Defluviitalea phaphyphila]